ncbi:MAG: type II toxin-antitoxin system HicA family toxin [Chloroflexota bacterium]
MPRLTPLRPRMVFRKLRRLGFVGPIPGGRHSRMVHPQTGQIIPVPVHQGKDISVGLIRQIIQEVGITREEWIEL